MHAADSHYRAARLSQAVYDPDTLPNVCSELGLSLIDTKKVEDTFVSYVNHADANYSWFVFQGTKNTQGWLTNLDAAKEPWAIGSIHSGFKESVERVFDWVKHHYYNSRAYKNRCGFTGHSKGAAEASVCVGKLLMRNQQVDQLITFGSPRVGDKHFAAFMQERLNGGSHRWVNNNDIVCRVPLPLSQRIVRWFPWAQIVPSGFAHFGTQHYIDSTGVTHLRPGKWRQFKDRLKGRYLAGSGWWKDGSTDHSMEHYVTAVERYYRDGGK